MPFLCSFFVLRRRVDLRETMTRQNEGALYIWYLALAMHAPVPVAVASTRSCPPCCELNAKPVFVCPDMYQVVITSGTRTRLSLETRQLQGGLVGTPGERMSHWQTHTPDTTSATRTARASTYCPLLQTKRARLLFTSAGSTETCVLSADVRPYFYFCL